MSSQQHLANIAKIIGVSLEDLNRFKFSQEEIREKVPPEKQKEFANEVAKLNQALDFEDKPIELKFKKHKVLWFLINLIINIIHQFKKLLNKCFPKSSQKV